MPFDDFDLDALDDGPEMLWMPIYGHKLLDWLERNPGDGPLSEKALQEGAWLIRDALKSERALRAYAELLGGVPSMD